MSNYGVGYDDESGGLLRLLRGKVREKVYHGFHTKTVEGNGCLPVQVLRLLFESSLKPFYLCFSHTLTQRDKRMEKR